jgi:hypothetical protein
MEKGRKFALKPYLEGHWAPEWYYTIVTFPIEEMLRSKTAEGCANEFIQLSTTPDWQQMCRRPVYPGDMIKYCDAYYLVVPTDQRIQFATKGFRSFALPEWKMYAIVELPEPKHEPV